MSILRLLLSISVQFEASGRVDVTRHLFGGDVPCHQKKRRRTHRWPARRVPPEVPPARPASRRRTFPHVGTSPTSGHRSSVLPFASACLAGFDGVLCSVVCSCVVVKPCRDSRAVAQHAVWHVWHGHAGPRLQAEQESIDVQQHVWSLCRAFQHHFVQVADPFTTSSCSSKRLF